MSQEILQHVESKNLNENACQFEIGDTVDVHTTIMEGAKERAQVFPAWSLP